jgi:uncharacterized protein (TIGR03435 family)
MARVSAATLIAWLTLTFLGFSQDVAVSHRAPKFAVAFVKLCSPTNKSMRSRTDAGGLSLGCWSLRALIQQSYDVFASGKPDTLNPAGTPTMPLEGLPGWAEAALYSIDAKTDAPQTAAMMRGPMMQALLEERFHLKLHREQREVPVYRITLAPGRLKLQAAKEGSCGPRDFSETLNEAPGDRVFCGVPKINRRGPLTVLDVRGITLKAFARSLHPDGRPVIDATGLKGRFDIHLEWGFDVVGTQAPASGPSPHASAADALREELGLRLTNGKARSEFLVVDHIERASDN